ncbi:MAG TPA: BrnA antitoxin family protein [Capsulimonadaceae bacterium]|jgi:uncharacterized protein (DUF4415 family)
MKTISETVRQELAALSGRSESDIDFTDIPATSPQDWSRASRGRFYRPIKKQLTVRIDADIIDWLKGSDEKGYQKRMNQILRNAMLSRLENNTPDQ